MEMIFCFCKRCLIKLDRIFNKGECLEMKPVILNAYTSALCARCEHGTEHGIEMAGTLKFEVELAHVEEKDGVHQYSEYNVIRYIGEA